MNRLFDDDLYWVQVNDGDERAFEIFTRHYTFRKWRIRTGKNGKRMAGPGETIVLLGKDGKALFIWKKQKYSQDDQFGVNCAVFRNENPKTKDNPDGQVSSEILLQAELIAYNRWPQERLFTYVNAGKIKSSNPGYCFKMAGWKQIGISKARKLIILEKLYNATSDN